MKNVIKDLNLNVTVKEKMKKSWKEKEISIGKIFSSQEGF